MANSTRLRTFPLQKLPELEYASTLIVQYKHTVCIHDNALLAYQYLILQALEVVERGRRGRLAQPSIGARENSHP